MMMNFLVKTDGSCCRQGWENLENINKTPLENMNKKPFREHK